MLTSSHVAVWVILLSIAVVPSGAVEASDRERVAQEVASTYSSTLVRGLLEISISLAVHSNGLSKTLSSLEKMPELLDSRIPRSKIEEVITVITNGDHWVAEAFAIYSPSGSALVTSVAVERCTAYCVSNAQSWSIGGLRNVATESGATIDHLTPRPVHIWKAHGGSHVRSTWDGFVFPTAIESLGMFCTNETFVYYPADDDYSWVNAPVRRPDMAVFFAIREEHHGRPEGLRDSLFDRAGYELWGGVKDGNDVR